MPRGAGAAVVQRRLQQRLADALALAARAHGVRRQAPQQSRAGTTSPSRPSPVSSSATQQPPGSVRTRCAGALDPARARCAGRSGAAGAGRGPPALRVSSSKKPSSLSRSAAGTSSAASAGSRTVGHAADPRRSAQDGRMRVLVAPGQVRRHARPRSRRPRRSPTGWRRQAPDDELDLAPMADGGPGFVDVLHAALGGELLAVTVRGPHGEPTPATVLLRRRARRTSRARRRAGCT